MANNLLDIYNDIIANIKPSAINAAKSTGKKIASDMRAKARENLAVYYAEYDPDVYDRTKMLRNAIRPIYKESIGSNHIEVEIGIRYDESFLSGYASNSWYHQGGGGWVSSFGDGFNWSSQNNGVPDPKWILDNFLQGIHPRTTTGYAYAPFQGKSQEQMMEDFIDNEVPQKIQEYMEAAILREFSIRIG